MKAWLADLIKGTGLLGWIARAWSLLLFIFMIMRILTPDPYAVAPVPLDDWFLLSLWGLAIVALMLAWRWPRIGGWLCLGLMALREVAWLVLKGRWIVNFLIVWLVVTPPALFYLLAANKDKSRQPLRTI